MNGKIIGILVTFIFAAVFGGLGIGFYISTNKVLKNGVQTEGIVIENRQSYDSDGDATYTPVVEFTLGNGEVYTASPNMSTSPPSYSEGDPIQIAYLPETPNSIIINTPFWTFWFPMIFIMVGAIPGMIMLALIASLFRKNSSSRNEMPVNIRSRSRDNEEDDEENGGGFVTRY